MGGKEIKVKERGEKGERKGKERGEKGRGERSAHVAKVLDLIALEMFGHIRRRIPKGDARAL